PTIPMAIHEALPPTVSKGLSEFELEPPFPDPKPAMTAAASITTDPISNHAMRLIGVRGSLRSVRYQWPSSRPSRTAPVNSAPARSWKIDRPNDSSVVRANATSMAMARGTVAIPTIRAADLSLTTMSASQATVAPPSAAAEAAASLPDDAVPGSEAPAAV